MSTAVDGPAPPSVTALQRAAVLDPTTGQHRAPLLPVPWKSAAAPSMRPLVGRYCRLEKLDPARHGKDLFAAQLRDQTGSAWSYADAGPYLNAETDYPAFLGWLETAATTRFTYAIFPTGNNRANADDGSGGGSSGGDGLDPSSTTNNNGGTATVVGGGGDDAKAKPLGVASLCHESTSRGYIEIGYLRFFPGLQRTAASTEAQYLLMREVFETLGFRRLEWRCDTLNTPSFTAALRLGFRYEGTLRSTAVIKGRNQDMAIFSLLAKEWPETKRRLEVWLRPSNFDDRTGRQRARLAAVAAKL